MINGKKKIVTEDAQCSETYLTLILTVLPFILDMVDSVLKIRSELGTWTN